MSKVVDIIVLDDGDDEEGPSCSPEAKESPSESPPPSEASSNEKKDDESGQKSSMSAENQKLFQEFVDYCSKLTVEHPEVIAFLQLRFSKATTTYLSSVEFRNALGRCLTRLQSKQSKVYVYINELCTLLKTRSEKKKVILQTQAATPQRKKEENNETPTEDAQEEVPERKAGSKHQIRRLENLLRLYSREIQKLQEKELSLEEMEDEDSTYIQESRLKQKLIRIYEKLCELKDCSSLTGRVIEQRIQYKGTRYQEVNRRLEKFINKTRDIFPDYGDVLREVQKANERHQLGLSRKQMQGIAQDAFRDLGNKLQHRRHLDMVYNFGCHLTDIYKSGHDPAEHDHSLARRLRDNRSLAENRLEDIIKKFAEMQDEGEEEDWKNKNQDEELPSTSKSVKDSPRSRKTESSKSGESEEDEEEDEESEESVVDIEEELRQSQEVADGEEDEEPPVDYLNETDQRMDPQNSSPAGKEEGENEETENSDQYRDEEDAEEGTDKDEDQDVSSAITSLSPDKEEQNTGLELEGETTDLTSPGDSNDAQLVSKTEEEHSEQENNDVTSNEADSPIPIEEDLEMGVFEEDVVGNNENNTEIVNVPYEEAEMPSSKEQGTRKCTDTTNDLGNDPKSPVMQAKEGKSSRLAKCISKLADGLTHKVAAGDEQCSSHVNNITLGSGDSPRTEEQSSNGKSVCVDTPTERWDSVRKIAFSHGRAAGENSDVVHLDNYKNSTHSNGVRRAVAMTSTPINRLKRKLITGTPTDSVFTVKVEELGSRRRKRKPSSQLWTENGVENGKQQKLMREKLSTSFTPYSSPSKPCSDNEHDITLDLMVTCSPQVTPTKTPSWRKKTDASTQCDPDEVIVLSD